MNKARQSIDSHVFKHETRELASREEIEAAYKFKDLITYTLFRYNYEFEQAVDVYDHNICPDRYMANLGLEVRYDDGSNLGISISSVSLDDATSYMVLSIQEVDADWQGHKSYGYYMDVADRVLRADSPEDYAFINKVGLKPEEVRELPGLKPVSPEEVDKLAALLQGDDVWPSV